VGTSPHKFEFLSGNEAKSDLHRLHVIVIPWSEKTWLRFTVILRNA